jgi:hypothetical protein
MAGHTTRGRQAFRQLAGDLACLAANGMRTCGPVNGCHMSSIYWFKTYVVGQSRPRDLRAGAKTWQRAANQHDTNCSLLYIWFNIYICLYIHVVWGATGPGLSPSPWSHDMLHITHIYIIWTRAGGCVFSNGYINEPPFGL